MNLQEHIKKVLREEVNKKFSKPNENINNAIYSWLNKYFMGTQIYKHESWKHYWFNFEFCKNGREIAELTVKFNDESPDWGPPDNRPTSERNVDEVYLYIYPSMVNMMTKVFPIRRNYLVYIIEEWFEDTHLDKVQSILGRNDLTLDNIRVRESKDKGDLCVPPMSKPEDVGMKDMMDYIKQRTLFSYQDMERHEEEQPGWVELTYLQKLHQEEQDRLNGND